MPDIPMNCSNCDAPVHDNFCSRCGQPVVLKRVDSRYILHEIQHVLHFEKGILFTIKELLIRPGQNVRTFITDNRSRLVKPILFIIVTSLIYTLVNKSFHIEEEYLRMDNPYHSILPYIFHWLQNHYGYANILMGVFIAWWLKLLFRQQAYNFFEILILLCFVIGMGMLISAVFGLVEGLTKVHLLLVSQLVSMVYSTWAVARFFDKKNALSYVKAFVAFTLGGISFYVVVVLLGVSIDIVIR
jgi:hypothetical protein